MAIGDGGNDVPMIQAASAGIGLVGKEGKQASLAADWSLTQFCHISRLLLVHGRNSYKRCVHILVSIGFWSFILGFAIFNNRQIIKYHEASQNLEKNSSITETLLYQQLQRSKN